MWSDRRDSNAAVTLGLGSISPFLSLHAGSTSGAQEGKKVARGVGLGGTVARPDGLGKRGCCPAGLDRFGAARPGGDATRTLWDAADRVAVHGDEMHCVHQEIGHHRSLCHARLPQRPGFSSESCLSHD
jgi:hypothetical protein